MMISRADFEHKVMKGLHSQAAVALIGPRQVGKTTLARQIADSRPGSLYLDLETREDRERLAEPVLFLRQYQDSLVVLDEIHRVPELFSSLRGIIDQGRRDGRGVGRFLILDRHRSTCCGSRARVWPGASATSIWALSIPWSYPLTIPH